MTYKYFLATNTCNNHLVRVMCGNSKVLDKINKASCSLLRLVFMNHMTYIINNYHLKFALHLSNCQFLIHSITSSKQKLFWNSDI